MSQFSAVGLRFHAPLLKSFTSITDGIASLYSRFDLVRMNFSVWIVKNSWWSETEKITSYFIQAIYCNQELQGYLVWS